MLGGHGPEHLDFSFALLLFGSMTVNFVDRPYGNHDGAISPTAMRGVLATMEREQAAIGHTDAHCNAAGQPT